ncbi:MAG: hypothetical protein H6Q19_747 [Bacteroidetes bacterium]|nr:hypothetical protein [Bacteroidota bacterium]
MSTDKNCDIRLKYNYLIAQSIISGLFLNDF